MLCEPKNKVMKKSNYCIVLLIFILLGSVSALSQDKPEKKFSFEIGLNHSFAAKKMKYVDNEYRVGIYLEGRHAINEMFNTGVSLDYSTFTRGRKCRTLGIIPFLNYDFIGGNSVKPFVGIGAGVSFNNLDGVFNDGYETNFCFMQSVGVRLFRHFTVAVNYELINKNYSHANARIGFYF